MEFVKEIFTIFVILLIFINHSQADVKISKSIEKPKECDKKGTRLRNGRTFVYSYTTTAESAFLGATESKSGFNFTCSVVVHIPKKCEAVLEVTDCHLYERQPGSGIEYKEAPTSQEFNIAVSKNFLYFKHNKGEIIPDSLVVADDEPILALNIKRGILSSLQLKLLKNKKYEGYQEQTDIFGVCPVLYTIPSDNSDTFRTLNDITLCKVPQVFKLKKKPNSIIQGVYGGYLESDVSEPFYPFTSRVKCTHKVNSKQRITSAECDQEQIFEPAAYNGTIYASAVSVISQKLKLIKVDRHKSNVDRSMNGKKNVNIKFQFDEGQKLSVTVSDIKNGIIRLSRLYLEGHIGSIPQSYNDLALNMRKAGEDVLNKAMEEVWACHGNFSYSCDTLIQLMEKDYFLDGLLSCGTPNCLAVFSHRLKDQTFASDPTMMYYFSYDLALNHPPSSNVVSVMLDVCIPSNRITCWLPLSIMVNKLFQDGVPDTWSKNDPVYRIFSHINTQLGKKCESGEWTALSSDDQETEEQQLILMFKVIGNIGKVIQMYDSVMKKPSDVILPSVLQCSESRVHPYHVVKSAIQALQKMDVTQAVEKTLFNVTKDFNREHSLRTKAFSILAKEENERIIKDLIKLLHDEPIENMKIYIESYIESMLENDQPDLKGYRNLWKNLLEADGRPLPDLPASMIGKSRYVEMSRYLRLPLVATFYGLQLEMDIVYNPASPVVQSVVIRLNYFAEKKHNIIELSSDLKGIEEVLDYAVGQKGAGLLKVFSIISKAQKISVASNDNSKARDNMFGKFQSEVVEELFKLFNKVNYPQKNIPDGLFYWKVYDSEVYYITLKDALKILQMENIKSKFMDIVNSVIYKVSKGYYRIKTRSNKAVDLLKILPTLSGAPLNMTVMVTSSQAVEIHSNLDINKFVTGIGPMQANLAGIYRAAVEFHGSMRIQMSQYMSCGCQMKANAQIGNPIETSVSFSSGKMLKTTADTLKKSKLVVNMRNQRGDQTIFEAKSMMYLLSHKKAPEVIPPDPKYEVLQKKCTLLNGLLLSVLTGNKVCMEARYPNVTTSKSHAYFPLSGPANAKVYVQPGPLSLTNIQLTADYEVKNMTTSIIHRFDVDVTAKGGDKEQNMEMFISSTKDLSEISAGFAIPHLDVNLTSMVKVKTSRGSKVNTSNISLDATYKDQQKITRQLKISRVYTKTKQEQPDPDKNNKMKTVYAVDNHNQFIFKMPDLRMDLEFHSLKENFESHIYTYLNWTYYCSKKRPLMYLLHWDTKLAEKNGDTSNIVLKNDAVFKSSKSPLLREANDVLEILYPGQDIHMLNAMKYNNTHANRDTLITYLNSVGEKEVLGMEANVENQTDETYHYYRYKMKLKHGDKYEIDLDGNMGGDLFGFDVVTDISYNRKKIKDKVPKNYVTQKDVCDDGFFDLKTWNRKNWKIKINMTGKSDFGLGNAIQVAYKLNVSYPSCNKYGHILSVGAVGQYLNNTKKYFRYWHRAKTLQSIGDTVDYSSVKDKDLRSAVLDTSILYNQGKRFYIKGSVNIVNNQKNIFNATYAILASKESKDHSFIHLQAHQKTPWKLLSYDIDNKIELNSESNITATSKLINVVVNKTDSGHLSYYKPQKRWTFQVNGTSIGLFPTLPWDIHYDIKGTFEKNKLSSFNVNFRKDNTSATNIINVAVDNPKELTITFSHQKAKDVVKEDLVWLLKLIGSESMEHTLKWSSLNRDEMLNKLKGMKNAVGDFLISFGDTLMGNIHRKFGDKIIPFSKKSIRSWYNDNIWAVIKNMTSPKYFISRFSPEKLFGNPDNYGNVSDKNWQYDGDLIVLMLMVDAKALKVIGGYLKEPPQIFNPFYFNTLRPGLMKVLADRKITFTGPIPFKTNSFLSPPELTFGQRYIYSIWKHRNNNKKKRDPTAMIYRGQYIRTFDNRLLKIPDVQSECAYLLTADFKDGKFALTTSSQGITLLTDFTTVTLDYDGRVFLGDCTKVLSNPIQNKDTSVTISRSKRGVIDISTKYGIEISCDMKYQVCSLDILHSYRNKTLGLFGTIDMDKGTDFRQPDGHFSNATEEFLPYYSVAGPPVCHVAVDATAKQTKTASCNSKMVDSCQLMFDGKHQSPLHHCYTKVNPGIFLSACLDEANDCSMDAESLCSHVLAYVYRCTEHGFNDSVLIKAAKCESYKDSGKSVLKTDSPVDIVFVLSNDEGFKGDIAKQRILSLILHLEAVNSDIRVGVLNYDSAYDDQTAYSSRYLLGANGMDANKLRTVWRTSKQTVTEALSEAANYPFRFNSHKLVLLLTASQESVTSTAMDALVQEYQDHAITFSLVGLYPELKTGAVLGINWDKQIIFNKSRKLEMAPLPQSTIMKLIEDTKGALLDLEPIIRGRKNRIQQITKHINQQIRNYDLYC